MSYKHNPSFHVLISLTIIDELSLWMRDVEIMVSESSPKYEPRVNAQSHASLL